jgi:hypothetical protein
MWLIPSTSGPNKPAFYILPEGNNEKTGWANWKVLARPLFYAETDGSFCKL